MGWWTGKAAEGPHRREEQHLRQEIARLEAMPASPGLLTAVGRLHEWRGDAAAAVAAYRRALEANARERGPLWRELQLEARIAGCLERPLPSTLEIVHAGRTTGSRGYACVLGQGSRSTDVCIAAATVASEHCAIWHDSGAWHVCDLETAHGTRLDGVRLTAAVALPTSAELRLAGEVVRVTTL